jgi:hypothetical protein
LGGTEHEVRRKPVQIPLDRLVKCFRCGPTKRRQIGVEHHPLATDQKDARLDLVDGHDLGCDFPRFRATDASRGIAQSSNISRVGIRARSRKQ